MSAFKDIVNLLNERGGTAFLLQRRGLRFQWVYMRHYKSKENTRKHHTQESQDVSPFQASGHKDARNSVIKTNLKHK